MATDPAGGPDREVAAPEVRVVDHKELRLHQIRYGVRLLPYDVLWSLTGGLLLLAGLLVAWRTCRGRGTAPRAGRPPDPS